MHRWIVTFALLSACASRTQPPPPPPTPPAAQGVSPEANAKKAATNRKTYVAFLRDASGLPVGSEVVMAGVPVGEIYKMDIVEVGGTFKARVTLRIFGDVSVSKDAILSKKSTSLLGNFFLELDPGSTTRKSAPALPDGGEITQVVEAASTADELIRNIDESIPVVEPGD